MSEPTPGPWTIFHETHVMGGDRLVAACGGYVNSAYPAHDTNAANARLIAAAPDMREVLLDILGWVSRNDGWEVMPKLLREKARAAIAKAEGKS